MEDKPNPAEPSNQPDLEKLFSHTLNPDVEAESRWEAIHALRTRAGQPVFERALEWCRNGDQGQQLAGVDILAQIGRTADHPETSFRELSYPVLSAMLAARPSWEELRSSLIMALHFLEFPEGIPLLCSFKKDESAEVRNSLAHALGFPFANDTEAVETLQKLMLDEDPDVRDWATFGLGSQSEADSEEIREALAARLVDPDPTVREEAVAGLAKRKDERAVPVLRKLILEGAESICTDEAVGNLLDLDWPLPEMSQEEMLSALTARYGA